MRCHSCGQERGLRPPNEVVKAIREHAIKGRLLGQMAPDVVRALEELADEIERG